MKRERPVIILVVFSALFFLAHQYLQFQYKLNISLLDNYLDPTVLMPLLLYAVLWERRILLGDKNIVLPYSHILGYFLLMVLVGEFIFPIISKKFVADYFDILAYAFGTLTYVISREFSNYRKLSSNKFSLSKINRLRF